MIADVFLMPRAPWAILRGMGNTKGATANNYLAYIDTRADDAAWARIKERMRPESRRVLLDEPVLTMSFVDYAAVMDLLLAADAVVGEGDRRLLREASHDNQVRNLNGIYRALLPLVSAEYLVKRASKLWERYHDTGQMKASPLGPGEVELVLSRYPDIPEHHAEEIEGAFEGLLELGKVASPRIEHTRCVSRGDPDCRWHIRWQA